MSLSNPVPTNHTPQRAALAADLAQWNQELPSLVRARAAADRAYAAAKAGYEAARMAADSAKIACNYADLAAGRCADAEFEAIQMMCEQIIQHAPNEEAADEMLFVHQLANDLRRRIIHGNDYPKLPAMVAAFEEELIKLAGMPATANADELPVRESDQGTPHEDSTP